MLLNTSFNLKYQTILLYSTGSKTIFINLFLIFKISFISMFFSKNSSVVHFKL